LWPNCLHAYSQDGLAYCRMHQVGGQDSIGRNSASKAQKQYAKRQLGALVRRPLAREVVNQIIQLVHAPRPCPVVGLLCSGHELCCEGDSGDSMWLLQEGQMQALRNGHRVAHPHSGPALLGEELLLPEQHNHRLQPSTYRWVGFVKTDGFICSVALRQPVTE
jgi:hypothetical protein